MSNIIVNADISENSSFVSNLTKLSKSQKPQTLVSSKISKSNNNNIQHDKSSFISKITRLSPKPTVLNADMSDNSSLVSNLTRLSHLSTKTQALNSEPESKLSFQRSVATNVATNVATSTATSTATSAATSTATSASSRASSRVSSRASSRVSDTKLSVTQIPILTDPTTSNINCDDDIESNMYSENSTHISVYSSENSDNQQINNTPIHNTTINDKPIHNTPVNNTPSIIKKLDDITNRVVIDVAVLCQEYTTIDTMCHDNIINLDEILITKEIFQSIFYPYHDNFGLNKDFVSNNPKISEHISFIPEFRSVNSKKFYLLEEIISNIERDLNISRNCFTKESLVELTNEIISIKSLCDINCCSVLSSLSWKNILEIIKNYKLINNCQCVKGPESDENYCEICKTSKSEIIPICVVNIIFKTPTPGVKNTIIRFNYRITNL
jgi:hypothetical protein